LGGGCIFYQNISRLCGCVGLLGFFVFLGLLGVVPMRSM